MTQTEREKALFRMLDIVLTVLLAVTLGLAGWTASTTVQHGNQIAEMSGSRFTSSDGLAVWQAIADLQREVASLPREVPPAWFVDQVNDIKAAVVRIDERLDAMERRIP